MTSLKSKCNLKGLLEKLNHDELKSFKSLLRLRLESGEYLQEFPWYEVEEANGKKLADILNSNFPGSSLRNVTLHILEKMDLTELSQTLEDVQAQVIDEPVLRHKEERLEIEKPDEDNYQESNFLLLNACTGQKEGWRNIIEKLSLVWKNKFCPRDSDHFQDVTQRSQKLIPFLSPQMTTEPTAHTVVLHGPSGVGKTTVAKRCLQDWTEGSQAYRCAFYLSCRELSHMAPCSFVELISKDCPELQDDMVDILAQAQELLFVVDGFDELRVPVQALICDICGDTSKEKPVPILLSSLLKRKIVPNATLLVTTRSRALQELILLVEQPLFIGIQGFLDLDRQAFFRKYFGDEDQALQALVAMKRNEALYSISSAPAVCWVICTCLKLQMERGEDLTLTCQITTSLFLQFLCFQFQPAPDDRPSSHLSAPLEALCLLAAQCLWTQVSVFYEEDLKRLGVKESDLHPFLDKGILQNDSDCMDCYSFMHLSVQQLLAAMFYILKREKKEIQDSFEQDIEDVRKLFSKEARVKNPNLAQVGLFLFGLLNRKRAQEVETTFGCQTSMEVKQELLQAKPGENQPFLHLMDLREVFSCLYESQEEELAEEAMVPFEEMSLQLRNNADLMNSSFCLKHCHNLRRISVQVAKGVFPEDSAALESYLRGERFQPNRGSLCRWMDLCSAICSNKNLSLLDISQSFLSSPSVRILCDYVSRVSCCLQKVVIRNVSPLITYRDFCMALIGKKTLTHLTLEGRVQEGKTQMLMLLGEMLKHARCNLQYLRLGFCSATTQQWADLFLTLQVSQSLTYLDLSDNELLDKGANMLCVTLKHPKCFLQRLSLENCHLTEASCKEFSSVLIINQRLTHLNLGRNDLGDGGVKILCEGLCYPECKVQSLVLRHCNITKHGCKHLSKVLQDCSLMSLDLGLNPIAVGLWSLCDAIRNPNFNLKCLGDQEAAALSPLKIQRPADGMPPQQMQMAPWKEWLRGCSISPLYCQELASALASNQKLETLDLDQNNLGQSGLIVILEALRDSHGPLKILRLKMDASKVTFRKLLNEVKESNPSLTIENVTRTLAPSYCDFLI